MKHSSTLFTSTLILLTIACGGGNSLESQKANLAALKKESLSLNAKIAALEKEIANINKVNSIIFFII